MKPGRFGSMLGALFETQVLGQLVRYFHHAGRRANVYFIRDQHGSEVDFVVPVGEAMHVTIHSFLRDVSLRACELRPAPDGRRRHDTRLGDLLPVRAGPADLRVAPRQSASRTSRVRSEVHRASSL